MLPAIRRPNQDKTRVRLKPKYKKKHEVLQVCISVYAAYGRGGVDDLMYTYTSTLHVYAYVIPAVSQHCPWQ